MTQSYNETLCYFQKEGGRLGKVIKFCEKSKLRNSSYSIAWIVCVCVFVYKEKSGGIVSKLKNGDSGGEVWLRRDFHCLTYTVPDWVTGKTLELLRCRQSLDNAELN